MNSPSKSVKTIKTVKTRKTRGLDAFFTMKNRVLTKNVKTIKTFFPIYTRAHTRARARKTKQANAFWS